jgi:hypothetical protein
MISVAMCFFRTRAAARREAKRLTEADKIDNQS